MTTFYCDRCHKHKTNKDKLTTGYGLTSDGKIHCYACCALDDIEQMLRDKNTTLYLANTQELSHGFGDCLITNWPGSLRINGRYSIGRHNITGKVYNVWFNYGHKSWYGRQFGDNTQILHCRQIKSL